MPDKKIKDLADKRTALIQTLLDKLEIRVQTAQRDLLKIVLADFVDGFEVDEDGNVKNTISNKRRFALFETVFKKFAQSSSLEVVKGITTGIERIVDFNEQYFSAFADRVQLAPIQVQVKETLSAWLGITNRGKVETNGYLDTLVKSEQVRNAVKNMVVKTVISQGGYNELKKSLQTFIEGNKEKAGALEKYYRNFAYDTFSVVDRTAAKITSDKLKFPCAVYNGGIIKDSRPFCRKRNGKVFTRKEISEFDPSKEGTNIAPGYNPFTELGSFGCRHHLDYIPYSVAKALRPDLPPEKECYE